MAVIVQIIDDGMHDDVEIVRWFELSPEEQIDTLTHVSDDGPEPGETIYVSADQSPDDVCEGCYGDCDQCPYDRGFWACEYCGYPVHRNDAVCQTCFGTGEVDGDQDLV